MATMWQRRTAMIITMHEARERRLIPWCPRHAARLAAAGKIPGACRPIIGGAWCIDLDLWLAHVQASTVTLATAPEDRK
jgi:hypothetical protein